MQNSTTTVSSCMLLLSIFKKYFVVTEIYHGTIIRKGITSEKTPLKRLMIG